ncbi:phosphatidylinositol/phosphatidylcholine transfer protein SFH1-like isoform X1 [Bidens hawaiensis]|uniref:phosphatidylinositol/phosphatidylcholine transfer protein SFH1-like isoform X1 n=1 Tax=Bidens hawaiensis TaxID=980011 RepID=UPI00404A16AC
MGLVFHEAINQFKALMDQVEEPLKRTFKNVHQDFIIETLERFLKAREGNVSKAHKMLVDSLQWRLQNGIDDILAKPIIPTNFYRGVRDSQLIGLSGYTREGLPVFAIGAGVSTYDKASVHYYVQSHIQINEYRDRVILPEATKRTGRYIGKCVKVLDMSGLKLSALNQLKLLTTISTVDDLNYPEKTITYYIVNVPYIFSACWKVVKPLLQERTKLKVRVLQGCGHDELLKIMDESSLPHFCRREVSVSRSWSGSLSGAWSGSWSGSGSGSGSSRSSDDDCYSLDHPFHQELYNYMKQQSGIHEPLEPTKHGSVHVHVPCDTEDVEFHKSLESELEKLRIQSTRSVSLDKV